MKERPKFRYKKLRPGAVAPTKAYEDDAGFDFYWCQDSTPIETLWTIGFLQQVYPTGLALEVPKGWFLRVVPRSGYARRYGVSTHIGTVDAGYREELLIVLRMPITPNGLSPIWKPSPGDKIAQGILLPVADVELEEAEELAPSARGIQGWGSSGG